MKVDPGPFALGDVGGRGPAVLCLHGLSGTPYEVRRPAEALERAGFACLGPLLPGHGTSPAELHRSRRGDWLDGARASYDRLQQTHSSVYLLGLSMGGTLALRLAEWYDVDGALVLAAPVDLGWLARTFIPLSAPLIRSLPKRPDIRDAEARAVHPSYDRMPLRSVVELIRLGREVEAELGQVTAPLRLVYSKQDRTVPLANAERIRSAVGSTRCDLHLLERSGHVMPVDLEADRIEALAVEFFADLEKAAAIDGPE